MLSSSEMNNINTEIALQLLFLEQSIKLSKNPKMNGRFIEEVVVKLYNFNNNKLLFTKY